MHTPLLRVGGRWVELEPQQVDAAKQFLSNDQPSGAVTLIQAIRVAQEHLPRQRQPRFDAARRRERSPAAIVPPGDAAEMLPLHAVSVSGWLETALDRLRGDTRRQPSPNRPALWASCAPISAAASVGWPICAGLGLGACLADDMGLGKTIQAIALLLHIRDEKPITPMTMATGDDGRPRRRCSSAPPASSPTGGARSNALRPTSPRWYITATTGSPTVRSTRRSPNTIWSSPAMARPAAMWRCSIVTSGAT